MGQGTSHNHHVSGGPAHHGERSRSNGSGVNFGSGVVPGQWSHHGDMIKEGSPYDGQTGPLAITAGPGRTPLSPVNKGGYRPRATTESGQRPSRPMRQTTLDESGRHNKTDLGSSVDSGNEVFASSVENDPEVSREKGLPTIFKYQGQGKEVYVCGTFNDWQKLRMNRSAKDFVAIVELAEGNHEYKFNVDGEWINDPNSPVVETSQGFKNNVIKVQKADFDAFEALDMDSAAVAKAAAHKRLQMNSAAGASCHNFSQEIPPTGLFENRTGPPILPPHLLQVILNKDTPMSCEPTLLPEPNRVMLNHLYALSIKDGVMVLSSTQRFRKKYVTTLLYKPMGVRKAEGS